MDAFEKIRKIQTQIEKVIKKKMTFLECYGAHTQALAKYSIRKLLPTHLEIISGPGCPVSVAAASDIDYLNELALDEKFQIASYGDLVRIADSKNRRLQAKPNVKVVYSPHAALEMAQKFPQKNLVFTAIGFENAAMMTASAIIEAKERGIENFFVLNLHKNFLPLIDYFLLDTKKTVDGLILPSDIALSLGPDFFLPLKGKCPAVITSFDPVTLMEGIFILAKNVSSHTITIQNVYKNSTKEDKYKENKEALDEVFIQSSAIWRGKGVIENTGMDFKEKYLSFDVKRKFPLETRETDLEANCLCSSVLWNSKSPLECPNFAESCTPTKAQGACMASSEGICQVLYKFDYDD